MAIEIHATHSQLLRFTSPCLPQPVDPRRGKPCALKIRLVPARGPPPPFSKKSTHQLVWVGQHPHQERGSPRLKHHIWVRPARRHGHVEGEPRECEVHRGQLGFAGRADQEPGQTFYGVPPGSFQRHWYRRRSAPRGWGWRRTRGGQEHSLERRQTMCLVQ